MGAALVIMMFVGARMWSGVEASLAAPRDAAGPARLMLFAAAGVIGLWLGSLEIDRFFHPGAGRALELTAGRLRHAAARASPV